MHFAWETKVDVRYVGEDRGNCFWQNKLSYNANVWYNYNDVGVKRYFALNECHGLHYFTFI